MKQVIFFCFWILLIDCYAQYSNDTIFHDNGNIYRLIIPSDSIEYWYYENGQKEGEYLLKNVTTYDYIWRDHPRNISWHLNGKIKTANHFSGDTLIEQKFFENGQLRHVEKNIFQGLSLDNFSEGLERRKLEHLYYYASEYCENGQQVSMHENWCIGSFVEYYCNGNISVQADSSAFCRVPSGYTKLYHENGKLYSEGVCSQIGPDGNRTPMCIEKGIWKYYNKNGELDKETDYGNNQ
jgi:antitoxin component YwqK of YwqJK toxin-antitoxin module